MSAQLEPGQLFPVPDQAPTGDPEIHRRRLAEGINRLAEVAMSPETSQIYTAGPNSLWTSWAVQSTLRVAVPVKSKIWVQVTATCSIVSTADGTYLELDTFVNSLPTQTWIEWRPNHDTSGDSYTSVVTLTAGNLAYDTSNGVDRIFLPGTGYVFELKGRYVSGGGTDIVSIEKFWLTARIEPIVGD